MKLTYLTRKDILKIHDRIISETGGERVILFDGNLDLCVESPQLEIYGSEIYKTIYEKAASLLYTILKLHPFLDGNKRTGLEASDVFLRINGYVLEAKTEEAVSACLRITDCSFDNNQTLHWMKARIRRKLVR